MLIRLAERLGDALRREGRPDLFKAKDDYPIEFTSVLAKLSPIVETAHYDFGWVLSHLSIKPAT